MRLILSLILLTMIGGCKARGVTNSKPANVSPANEMTEIQGEGWTDQEFELARDADEVIDASANDPELSLIYPGNLRIPDMMGTQYANNLNQKDIDMISAMGMKYIRIVVHVTLDRWDLYDPRIEGMWAKDITPIITIVSAENMDDPLIRDKYIAGAARVAARYARGSILWDIYNEPTSPIFWPTKATPAAFADYAVKMINGIKAAAPGHKVVLPSIQRTDATGEAFLMGVFAAKPELLTMADLVGIHTYGPASGAGPFNPEYKASAVTGLRSRFLAKFKKSPPWMITEFGWHTTGGGSVSKATQGIYAPRLFLMNAQIGLLTTVYYQWRDEANEIGRAEPGLLTIDYQPRPGYAALQSLINNMSGYSFVRSLTTGTTHAQLWRASGLPDKIAAWAETGGVRNVTVKAPNGKSMVLSNVSTAAKYFTVPATVVF